MSKNQTALENMLRALFPDLPRFKGGWRGAIAMAGIDAFIAGAFAYILGSVLRILGSDLTIMAPFLMAGVAAMGGFLAECVNILNIQKTEKKTD